MAKVIISGGGTGGHVFPAIAIANALREIDKDTEILFVGAKGKIEMEKVPQAGYEIKGLTIAGFHRKWTTRNLTFPFKLIGSLFTAWSILRKFKPDVAVGTGGYASGPVLKVAGWRNIPSLIQEANSYPGVTNRLLAVRAGAICVAFDKMERYFPEDKIRLTGNPVREEIVALGQGDKLRAGRAEACKHFGLDPTKPVAFVTGGSLGARVINEAVAHSLDALQAENVQLIWQTGKHYLEDYAALAEGRKGLNILDFITRMDLAYTAADVIVSRAGGTISELCIIGKPTILLPSPNVAEDHQTRNVENLVEKEATVLVKDKEANEKLGPTIIRLMHSQQERDQLSQNIKQLARPNAAATIAKEVLKLI